MNQRIDNAIKNGNRAELRNIRDCLFREWRAVHASRESIRACGVLRLGWLDRNLDRVETAIWGVRCHA